jgi:hypothetical protein
MAVGYSPFNVIAVLLNVVLSMAVKWQLRSELALRSSKLDYTVFRPGGLTDHGARPQEVVRAQFGGGGGLGGEQGEEESWGGFW